MPGRAAATGRSCVGRSTGREGQLHHPYRLLDQRVVEIIGDGGRAGDRALLPGAAGLLSGGTGTGLGLTHPTILAVPASVRWQPWAALVAAKSPARLAHVERGLRSRDWTMPEDENRLVTYSVCDDPLAAPSPDAVEKLLAEGRLVVEGSAVATSRSVGDACRVRAGGTVMSWSR